MNSQFKSMFSQCSLNVRLLLSKSSKIFLGILFLEDLCNGGGTGTACDASLTRKKEAGIMPSGGTGLSKVGAFVVLQGTVGFEAFELGITETSGETGVGLYDCALKSSSWISPLSQLFGTVLLSSLNNDEFRVIVRPSPWTVIMPPFLRMTVFGVGSYTVALLDALNGLLATRSLRGWHHRVWHPGTCCLHEFWSWAFVTSHACGQSQQQG